MKPQQQFENPAHTYGRPNVSFAVVDGKVHLFRGPWAQTPVLIVQKNAAVLDRRRSLHMQSRPHIHRRMMRHRNIGPPGPRRHAHLARESEERIRRAAPVVTRNHQRQLHPRQHARRRIQNCHRLRRFPLAVNRRRHQPFRRAQLVELRRLTYNTHHDQIRRQRAFQRSQDAAASHPSPARHLPQTPPPPPAPSRDSRAQHRSRPHARPPQSETPTATWRDPDQAAQTGRSTPRMTTQEG